MSVQATQTAPRLGELLVERGLLSPEQLAHGLAEAQRVGRPLGQVLVELGFVSPPTIARALATQHGGVAKSEYGYAVGYDVELGAAPVGVDVPPVTTPAVVAPAPPPVTVRQERTVEDRVAQLEMEVARLQTALATLLSHQGA